ncbi:MAG: hypothetical protein RIF32_06775 [Leptospirales bacterium]
MRYYNGLFLQQEEFQLEQDYNVRMRRMHNARLHGRGIVWGLEVVLGTIADTVLVKKGMALDYYHEGDEAEYTGREIVVVENTPVDLSQYSGDDEIWLWIRYDENPAGDDPARGDQPFNTIEGFQIEHSLTRPIDNQLNLILARIIVNFDGSIDENSILFTEPGSEEPIRVGSGIAGARVETDRLDIRVKDQIADQWPYLVGLKFSEGGPPSDIGIQAYSNRTEFLGAVDVDTNLTVRNELLVEQGAVIQQNARVVGDLRVDGALSGRVPLGGVLAVFNYGGNIPAASGDITADGFMLADGQALPATTALHAMATGNSLSTDRPDLTNDVFLMGATSSGNVGGANSVTVTIPEHSHSSDNLEVTDGSTVSDELTTSGPSGGLVNHTHGITREPAGGNYVSGPYPYLLDVFTQALTAQSGGPSTVSHSHTVSVAFDLSGLDVSGQIGSGQSGDIEMSANAHENRPSYVSAVYLIRVN